MFRILIWLVELGILFALAIGAFISLSALGRSLAGIARAAAAVVAGGAVSGFAGLVAGLAGYVAGVHDPIAVGLLATIVTFPPSVWLLGRLGRRRRERQLMEGDAPHGTAVEPASDRVVATAWRRAAGLAPTQRHRLAPARDACAHVLQWTQAHPFDMETMECAVLIRKRLPELVEKTARYHALADRAERRSVVEAMVSDLESLGRMARRRVDAAKSQLGDSLAATRAHIASRTGGEPVAL